MSDDAVTYAYLDTNALLEFRPARDLDWRRLLGAERVVLMISPVVVKELQKIKDGGSGIPRKKRQRAGDLLKRLEDLLHPYPDAPSGPSDVREGVTMVYDRDAIPPEVFSTYRLDNTLSDDRLVAGLLRGRDSGRRVCLVSNDAGPRLTAKAHRLRAFDLPDDWRVKDEPDPLEAENLELKKKLHAYESRAPKLSLRLADGGAVLRYTVPKPRLPIEEHVQRQLEGLRSLHRLRDCMGTSVAEKILESFHGAPSKEAIEKYTRDLANYLDDAERLLPAIIAHRNLLDLYVPVVAVTISNDGSQPAEHVRVVLRPPDGLKLKTHLPDKEPTKLPEPPKRPRSARAELIGSRRDSLGIMAIPGNIMPNISRALFAHREPESPYWAAEGAQVAISTGTIRHATRHNLPLVYLVLPSNEPARSFHMDYELHAYNIAPPVKGQIHIVLDQGDRHSPLQLREEDPSGRMDEENDDTEP